MSGTILDRLIRDALFRELRPRLQAAMEAAFDDAWEAAMAGLAQPSAPASHVAPIRPSTVATMTVAPVHSKPPNNVGKRAGWGTTRKVIQGAFASQGTGGATPKAIADWGAANGQPVAASSVRSALQKMQKTGEVRRRKDRYFWSVPAAAGQRGGSESPNVGISAAEDSGANGSWSDKSSPPP